MSSLVGTNSPKGPEKAGGPPAQQSLEAMNAEPLRRTVVITNPLGFHMRPMSAFVQLALKFQSKIYVIGPAQQRVEGRSMLGLMGLAAEQGTELTLEAEGPDQAEALDALARLLDRITEEESGPQA